MMFSENAIVNICSKLACKPEDITDVERIKAGLTNTSFVFSCKDKRYVYRQPGEGTERFINRESEAFSETVAKKLGIEDALVWIDPDEGWKISRYIECYEYINPQDDEDRKLAMETLHKLHDSEIRSPWDFDYCHQMMKILQLPGFKEKVDFSEFAANQERVFIIGEGLKSKGYSSVLCHNDAWAYNMLKEKGKINLIDWEYSGNSYPAADVAYFTGSYDSSDADYLNLAETYEGHALSKQEQWYYFAVMAIVFWYWFVWALYKEATGTAIEDKNMWFEKALHALDKAEKLYEDI